jgi:RNA polymerase-binding transcription factor DksA
MDGGSYGVSEVSGEPIPSARLRAVPWASRNSDE